VIFPLRIISDNLKNVFGWRTSRKLIVFAVDDYGNVRVHSRKARENMDREGLRAYSRFDVYDALETKEDLEMLFSVLSSVKDSEGKPAVFTAFALACNINFDKMEALGYESYISETVDQSFQKRSDDCNSYRGAWQLWQEGIRSGLMAPEFHGREHFNVKILNEKLAKKDIELLTALKYRSLASISNTGQEPIKFTAAFAFRNVAETEVFPDILETGLRFFHSAYHCKPCVFTPPAHQFPFFLEPSLASLNLVALDKPFITKEHTANERYQRVWRTTGYHKKNQLATIVRNVVFEPAQETNFDWVQRTLAQIESAFRWQRPAVISSHRVNFCGHIHPENRAKGLLALQQLLKIIIKRWPEVEFVSAAHLASLILGKA